MLSYLLNIVYALLLVAYLPIILYKVVKQGRYREGWGEKFGFVPKRESGRRCIWIHAVSMGEVNAAKTLVEQIRQDMPEVDIVVSSTTDTGINRARKIYGDIARVIFYPFDFTFAVKRSLSNIKLDLCILMELEAWPNFTKICHKRDIPVVVANGRISSGKGFPRYKKIAWLIRPMFGRLAAVMVQDEEYAERFEYLGVNKDKITVAGSVKYDTAEVTDKVAGSDEMAKQLGLSNNNRLIVAGSTGVDEEKIIIDAFKVIHEKYPETRLAVIPRKPERFDEIAGLIENEGFSCLRYSRIKSGEYAVTETDSKAIILGDTMGDLRKFYSLAEMNFVGRSLVPMGGSDMMEAAALGKPVIVGPYTENFAQTIDVLKAGTGIIIVQDGKELTEQLDKLLLDSKYAASVANCGRQVIIDNKGATKRTIAVVQKLLNK